VGTGSPEGLPEGGGRGAVASAVEFDRDVGSGFLLDCEQVEDALNSLHLSFRSGAQDDALLFRFFRCPSASACTEGARLSNVAAFIFADRSI